MIFVIIATLRSSMTVKKIRRRNVIDRTAETKVQAEHWDVSTHKDANKFSC